MPDRENFNFNPGELGIMSTEELIDAGENFLNSDPSDIKLAGSETEKEKAEKLEKEKKEKEDKEKAEKSKLKEVVIEPNEVDEDSLLNELGGGEEGTKTPKSKPEVKKEEETDTSPEPDSNVFSTIAKELYDQGVFIPDEDEEGNPIPIKEDLTPEEFLETFQTQTKKQAADIIEKFLERFGDDYKDMFENVFVKGIPPADYLGRYTKIQSINSIDLADEDNQERVVRELYKSEGRSSEYIEKRITQLKNYSDLLDEATEAKRILSEKETKAIQKAAEDKQIEIARQQQIKSEYINNVNKIISEKLKAKEFDGIPVTKPFADNIYSYLTKEKYQTADKQLLTEFDKDILDLKRPENHEMKVKIAMLLQLAKTDPQLSTLAKKAVSKETNKLFSKLEKVAAKTSSKEQDEEEKPKSWFANK